MPIAMDPSITPYYLKIHELVKKMRVHGQRMDYLYVSLKGYNIPRHYFT